MIAIQSITKGPGGSWVFSWNSDGSPFWRVVLDGLQLATNLLTTTYTFTGIQWGSLPPPLEIASGNNPVLSETYKPYIAIQWLGEACQKYLVQILNGSTWQTVQMVQETGQWYYSYQTPVLEDETVFNYQVVAVDAYGNMAPARSYSVLIVTPPDPPDASTKVSYAANNLLITAVT